MDKKYQVFISSTFKDLELERKKAQEAVLDMGCFPAGMELFPASDIEQFEYIKKIIDVSDYIIIISGNKYGTIAPDGIGYTEKEFLYAEEKEIPVLAFLNEEYVGETDIEKKNLLDNFRDKLKTARMVKFWRNPEELKSEVITGLHHIFTSKPMKGWVRGGKNDYYAEPREVRVYYGNEEPQNPQEGDIWIG